MPTTSTNNTAREKILEAIVNPPEDCLNEPEYGGKWRTLYAKFDEKIQEMTTTMFDRYIIGHAPFGAYLLEREIVKNKYVKGRTPFFHIKIGNTDSNSVFESAPFPKTQSINCWVRGSEKDFMIAE